MCNFFSAISDGKGKTLFFTLADIVNIMASGNTHNINFNSHTSISHHNGINGAEEDKWNKWEYDCTKKELKIDQLNTTDDSDKVKADIVEYLNGKDIRYVMNLYNRNSGESNSGSSNSGNWNSGSSNSGDSNIGDCNSGDSNSGNRNSGNWNSGNWNSGNWNSGNWNSGSSNSGDSNIGDCNSGNRNSGNWNSGNSNSGNWNSGNSNSGNWNSGDGCFNSFCSIQKYFLFDIACSKKEYEKTFDIHFSFILEDWIYSKNMTNTDKSSHPEHTVTGGFLKTYSYREAWKNAWDKMGEDTKNKIMKLKNFNAKKFEKITGIKISEPPRKR